MHSVKRSSLCSGSEDVAHFVLSDALKFEFQKTRKLQRITDVDAKSNRSEEPDKVSLLSHEREKKKKHIGACLEQNVGTFLRLWFVRMVSSVKKPRSC